MEYILNNNYFELISGTSNFTNPVYTEAVNDAEKGTDTGIKHFAKFIDSIESLAKKGQVVDARLSSSKGNIKNFEGYGNIKTAISFLNKNLKGIAEVSDCVKVFDALENYSSLYEDGYRKNVRLVVLEYENALYMLTTSLSSIIATNMDVVTNGTEIRIQKKSASTHGTIQKTMSDLAKELSNRDHKDYLENIIKAAEADAVTESAYTEGTVSDTAMLVWDILKNTKGIIKGGLSLINKIKKSVFGIVPLIRSIMYLRYKKKADTIVSLEEQIIFIERNIDQLKNIKTMDEVKKRVIIKKQEAVIEAYKKKSEKLRAELMETEKQASQAMEKDNKTLKDIKDDDLVLEAAVFTEKKIAPKAKSFMKVNRSISPKEIERVRNDKRMDSLTTTSKVKEPDEKTKSIIKSAADSIIKANAKKSIRLNPGKGYDKDDDMSKRTDTKIGGIPYWPKDQLDKWPASKGRKMFCLAQLNLDKLPKMENYPNTGLLQFFIVDEEEYDSNACKVVYWKSYKDEAAVTVPNDVFQNYEKMDWAAINDVHFPTASQEVTYPCFINETINLDDEIVKAIAPKLGKSWKVIKDVDDEIIRKYIIHIAWSFNASWGTRIDGWASYTQYEPSYVDKDTVNMLQLDSEDGMMWGDCGIAHFFIQKSDLKSLKFDNNVMFTWDCC